jgi:FtsH-binding integral membrane protein
MDSFDDSSAVRSTDINSVLTNTFFRMFLGLLASAVTAIYAYSSGLYMDIIMNGYAYMLLVAEVVVVIIFSLLFRKLSPTAVTVLFFGYAFLNGFTLSVVFATFELSSIGFAFAATSALFGILSFIGYKTDRDISHWGTILIVALLIGVVLTGINLFVGNAMLDIVLDWAILFVFFGLTVYDINKIKAMHEADFSGDEKLYVYGAMELYLDFINIFLRILSIMGKRKN